MSRVKFEWLPECEDLAKSMFYLIKHNGGYFKSDKQAKFFYNKRDFRCDNFGPNASNLFKKYFGVDVNFANGEYVVCLEGTAVYAGINKGDSARPVTHIMVCDEKGIVRHYKIRYKGSMNNGTSPDPNKTELKFQRNQ